MNWKCNRVNISNYKINYFKVVSMLATKQKFIYVTTSLSSDPVPKFMAQSCVSVQTTSRTVFSCVELLDDMDPGDDESAT